MASRVKEVALILCDRVKREAGTNKATLDGVFDRVMIKNLPAALNCTLHLRILLEDTTILNFPVRLQFLRSNGSVERIPDLMLNVASGRCEGDVNFQNFPILATGLHRFMLMDGNETAGSVSFEATEVTSARPTSN